MKKTITITITTTVTYDIIPENYDGCTNEQMLECDINNAKGDHYYLWIWKDQQL